MSLVFFFNTTGIATTLSLVNSKEISQGWEVIFFSRWVPTNLTVKKILPFVLYLGWLSRVNGKFLLHLLVINLSFWTDLKAMQNYNSNP